MKISEKTKDVLENIGLILTIGFFCFVCWLCQGCKSYRMVEVQVHDTLVVRDSVGIVDTVIQTRVEKQIVENNYFHEVSKDYAVGMAHPELGLRVDTVKIYEKEIWDRSSQKEVVDSLVRALERYRERDSVAKTNESRIEEKVIEKPLTMQQRAMMMLGQLFFYLIVIAVVAATTYWIINKCRGKK